MDMQQNNETPTYSGGIRSQPKGFSSKNNPNLLEQGISIGKYSYDMHSKTWMAHPSTCQFPNALVDFQRTCKDDIIADGLIAEGKKDLDCIEDDLLGLKFVYDIPVQDVIKQFPKSTLRLLTTYEVDEDAKQLVLVIKLGTRKVGEVTIPSSAKGEFIHESTLKWKIKNRDDIIYSLDKSGGSLRLKNIELVVGAEIASPVKVQNQSDAHDSPFKKQNSESSATTGKLPQEFELQTFNISPNKTRTEKQESERQGAFSENDNGDRLQEIAQIHHDNNLANKLKKMNELQKYQDMVEFKIPLNELYELQSACLHTDGSSFCAVLVKIRNKTILQRHSNKKFLLQIWQQGGQMVFERSLQWPVCNWNMTGDNFVFQERPNSSRVWLIHLREDQSVQIHQFKIPVKFVEDQIGTYYSSKDKRLIVPPDSTDKLDNSLDLFGYDSDGTNENLSQLSDDGAEKKVVDDNDSVDVEKESEEKSDSEESQQDLVYDETDGQKRERENTPFSKRFCRPFIERAPDKMMDYLDSFIVIAFRHIIYYFDVSEYLLKDDDTELAKEVVISEEEIRCIKVKETKKIISFPELNSDQSCIVIEDLLTREVSFLAFKLKEDEEEMRLTKLADHQSELLIDDNEHDLNQLLNSNSLETNYGKRKEVVKPRKKMHLIGLSVIDAKPHDDEEVNQERKADEDNATAGKSKSPLLKFRSSAIQEDENSLWSQVGLLLREDGTVDVYADFIYVDTIFDKNYPCVDIEAGHTNFFFKMVNERAVKLDTDPSDLKKRDIQVKRVKKQWKNRISKRTLQKDKILDSWSEVLHERVAPFFFMFTKIASISTFMLVSHQNMISVFNMGDTEETGEGNEQSTSWVDTVQVGLPYCHIRKLQVVKKKANEDTTTKFKRLGLKKQITRLSRSGILTSTTKNKKTETKTVQAFDKFIISCLVGPNKLVYIEIDAQGKFKRKDSHGQSSVWREELYGFVEEEIFEQERVLQLVNDKSHKYGTFLLLEQLNRKQHNASADFSEELKCLAYRFPMNKADRQMDMRLICIKKQREFQLLSAKNCKKHQQIVHDCHLGLRSIRREDFIYKGKKINGGKKCEVKEAYPDKKVKILRALSISANQETKLLPLVNNRSKTDKQKGKEIRVIQTKRNTRAFNAEGQIETSEVWSQFNKKQEKQAKKDQGLRGLNTQNVRQDYFAKDNQKQQEQNKLLVNQSNQDQDEEDQEEDVLLEAFYLTKKDFGKERGCFLRISKDKIRIYNADRTLRWTYKNFTFQQVIQVQESYLYAAQDANFDEIETEEHKTDKTTKVAMKQMEGLYVYNVSALLDGSIEPYKVSSQGTGGGATLLQYNIKYGRLSFMEDFNTIVVIPLPQLNMINFIGMRNKQHYLMWREKKGFFTAMNINGGFYTWSILSGKLLYSTTKGDSELKNYEVYQSDPKDITYTSNAYNLETHSLTLLKAKEPEQVVKSEPQKFNQHVDQQEAQLIETERQQTKLIDNFEGMSFEKCSEIFAEDADCLMKDSAVKFSEYHFKVMQLRTHEDDPSIVHDCRVKFHFKHPLIKQKQKTETNTVKVDGQAEETKTNDFEADINDETVQRLYLSMNTKYMMEVISDKFAIVYRRQFIQEGDEDVAIADSESESEEGNENEDENEVDSSFGGEIKWRLRYKITRWPSNLTDRTSVPFMFSPNFKYQIDFDNKRKAIIILKTKKQKEYYRIPEDMINTEWKEAKEGEGLPLIFSRMKWVQDSKENRLHLVNQSNIDCIFEIIEHKEPSKRGLKLVSVCKIDNLNTDINKPDSPHFFYEPYKLEATHVTERLIRMNQNYKRAMLHAINLKTHEDDDKFVEYMVQHVQKIDYMQSWQDIDSYFAIDMSFTWLDWLIIEEAIRNEKFKMKKVSDQQKLQLSQNVLPNGKGILHMLAVEKKAKMSHINQLARDLFSFSSKEADINLLHVDDSVTLEIPILNDYDKMTALDICLDVNKFKSKQLCPEITKLFCAPRQFFSELQTKNTDENKKKDKVSSKNIMLADAILENIKEYDLLHSSQQILDALIVGSRLGLPAVKNYLESRVKATKHPLLAMSYPKMDVKYVRESDAIDGEYGTVTAQVFGPVSDIKDKIFKAKGAPQPTAVQTIDLPELYEQGERGRDFIKALTECKDPDFFTKKSVQVLIDHHYYFWYKINLYSIVVPAFIQVLLFWFMNNFVLPIRLRALQSKVQDNVLDPDTSETVESLFWNEDYNLGDTYKMFGAVIAMLTFYLFCYDMTVLLTEIWHFNDMDSAPLGSLYKLLNIFLHYFVLANVYDQNDERLLSDQFWQVQSWVALAVWFRIIATYLGEIQQFSWLVGLIKYSCNSTITFLTVFMCFITAFADAFNAIEQKMFISGDAVENDAKMTEQDISIQANFNKWLDIWQVAFRSSLGDFNDDEQLKYYSYTDWIIFFLSCFFLIILMLNLLISVISAAQADYTEARVQSTYKEKAVQIQENCNSFFGKFYRVTADPNQMLYIVQQASSRDQLNELTNDNSMQAQMEQIQDKIMSINTNIEDINDNNDDNNAEGEDQKGQTKGRTASKMNNMASRQPSRQPSRQASK